MKLHTGKLNFVNLFFKRAKILILTLILSNIILKRIP